MPLLLLRGDSSTSLSTLVENAQKKLYPLLEYDLQLNNGHLDLILIGKPDRKINSTSTDEGFESDIDSLSIISSDNDSFTTEKSSENPKTNNETDSANGSSSSDSDTDVPDNKNSETSQEKAKVDFKINPQIARTKESYNLVDCVCYTDVKCTDILIFVIRKDTFVFKFDDVNHLQNFYTNFTTLKAVTNQKVYNKNFGTKFNLLQRTDRNGITHIEVTREAELHSSKENGPSSIISISTPEENFELPKNKPKDVNSRQRTESQFIDDLMYNSKTDSKPMVLIKSNSIENLLDLDRNESNLVTKDNKKVWNSAEDLLDPPKRPERRKKGKAPQPPGSPLQKQDVFSGQYVRVNVNFDPAKDLDKSRLIIKSTLNEPHPKKLQNFNMFSTKPSLTSLLKPREKHVLKYEPKKSYTSTLGRNLTASDYNWTNSVPRLLKKPKTKSDSRTAIPMAYRYIDTTQDYAAAYNRDQSTTYFQPAFGPNIAFSNYLRGDNTAQNINSRLFGLSSKLRDLPISEHNKETNWKGVNDIKMNANKDNNLKGVIKINKDDISKKKNEKKVTFSAYTTVQVV